MGVKVALRMSVVDSKDSYDILLGRDWLHKVKAIGTYGENKYSIQAGGKTATLQGQKFSQNEVKLSDSSSEGEDSDSEDSSSDSDDESSDDEESEEESEEEDVRVVLAH